MFSAFGMHAMRARRFPDVTPSLPCPLVSIGSMVCNACRPRMCGPSDAFSVWTISTRDPAPQRGTTHGRVLRPADERRRAADGATFHTLRHTAASLLAELGEPEAIRKEVMGHRNIATTQRYTHLRPVHEIPAHERLAEAVPIADLVTLARKRASGTPVGKDTGTQTGPLAQIPMLGQGERTSTHTPDRRLPATTDVHVKSARP